MKAISVIFMIIVLVMFGIALNTLFGIRSEAREYSQTLANIEQKLQQLQQLSEDSDNKKGKKGINDIIDKLDNIADTVDRTYQIEINRQIQEQYK